MKAISNRNLSTILILCFGFFTNLCAQELIPTKKLISPDRNNGDSYGWAISADGDYMIVGAPSEYDVVGPNGLNTYAGAAYILKKDSNGNWKETQKLMASNRRLGAQFGFSVGIYGKYAVVGANEGNWSGGFYDDFGSAYIFKRDSLGVWQEIQHITNPDSTYDGQFGESVAIYKNNLVIGCSRCRIDTGGVYPVGNAGMAFFYNLGSNGIWSLSSTVTASLIQASAEFGIDVDITDSTSIIGAVGDAYDKNNLNKLSDAGAAYIFKQLPNGQWVHSQKIVASNRGQYSDFGRSVSIDQNIAVVGSPKKRAVGVIGGMAYVIEKDGSGIWLEKDSWHDPSGVTYANFGWSVDVKGDNAIIGAPNAEVLNKKYGAAFHYKRDSVSKNWLLVDQFFAGDRQDGDFYGFSVEMDRESAYVGAFIHELDTLGQNPLPYAGAVYSYKQGCIKDSIILSLNGKFLSAQSKTNGKWVWINCDSNSVVPNPPIDSIKIIANGNYRAIFINNSGCVDSSACFSVMDVGTREEALLQSTKIYPNPFQTSTNIKLSDLHQNSQLIVRDIAGREILQQETYGAKECIISLQGYPSGIYLLTVTSNDSASTYKLVKE